MNDTESRAIADAVGRGDVDALQQWLDAGGKPDECVCQGMYLVHVAANAGSLPCLQLLVASGASLKLADKSGYSPLQNAALSTRLETVHYLLEQAIDIDATDKEGKTALQLVVDWSTEDSVKTAVRVRDVRSAIAKALIEKGAGLHLADRYGCMALHTAARNGEVFFVELLLEAGCDPNAQNLERFGPTALGEAIMAGMTAAAERLVEAGADVNLADAAGNTPLHAAVFTTDEKMAPEMVGFLLERGADPAIRNKEGKTAEETIVYDPATSKVFAAHRSQKAIETVLQRARGAQVSQP